MSLGGKVISGLKVVELKNELEKRGLSKSGKKDELILRLCSYIEANGETGAIDENRGKEIDEKRDDNGVSETSAMESIVTEDVENKLDMDGASEELEKQASIDEKEKHLKADEEELTENNEEYGEKPNENKEAAEKSTEGKETKEENIEDCDTDKVEPEHDQLKSEIEEEILKEERRLKREDERRLKAKKPQDDDSLQREQNAENKQREEENKKEKRKRIEWPKSPAKHKSPTRKSEQEERKPKSPTKKPEHEERSTEKVTDKTEKEDVADDTLVMEIDQSDMVAEDPAKEDAEPLLEAEPGQVTSFRKLGGKGQAGEGERRKRGWGNRGAQRLNSSENLEISSKDLKDIVPDLKPLLTATASVEALEEKDDENGVEDGVEGPELPNVKKEDEIPRKKKKRVEDSSETEVIQIVNLTRPFTVNQLKEMLKRTGSIEDFWIDRIKSKCLVHFSTVDQASETRMALDGVKWPVSNPKTLHVTFSSKEALQRLKESSEDPGRVGGDLSGRIGGLREWDKNKVNQEGDRGDKRERDRKERRDRDSEKVREKHTPERKQPTKTLEELFKKTTTTPSIYWIPLSEEQIKQKEEQRNRKIMEADLLRETMNKMMQEKDGRRSKPRLASGRRKNGVKSEVVANK